MLTGMLDWGRRQSRIKGQTGVCRIVATDKAGRVRVCNVAAVINATRKYSPSPRTKAKKKRKQKRTWRGRMKEFLQDFHR
jgi:hypothetical protein